MMGIWRPFLDDKYDEILQEQIEEQKKWDKLSKAFKKASIKIENEEFEDLMRKIIQEELDKRENKQEKKDIMTLGNLSLSYKTFIGRTAAADEIEICQWDEKHTTKWTIASFDYDEEYEHYKLNSCGDRLRDTNIDWTDFGILVQKGYEILNDFID